MSSQQQLLRHNLEQRHIEWVQLLDWAKKLPEPRCEQLPNGLSPYHAFAKEPVEVMTEIALLSTKGLSNNPQFIAKWPYRLFRFIEFNYSNIYKRINKNNKNVKDKLFLTFFILISSSHYSQDLRFLNAALKIRDLKFFSNKKDPLVQTIDISLDNVMKSLNL